MSWPRLFLKFVLQGESHLDDIMDLHLRMSTRMAAHVKGVFANIGRTQWALTSLVSTDAVKAQIAARSILNHLFQLRPSAGNYFEEHFKSDDSLMLELERFANSPLPCKLWRGHGAYRNLYRFIAPRCLANGDSVVPVEAIHSRWQREERARPHMKLILLNSVLRINYSLHEGERGGAYFMHEAYDFGKDALAPPTPHYPFKS